MTKEKFEQLFNEVEDTYKKGPIFTSEGEEVFFDRRSFHTETWVGYASMTCACPECFKFLNSIVNVQIPTENLWE